MSGRLFGRGAGSDAGMTIVELLVAMVVFAIFGTLVTGMLAALQHAQVQSHQTNDLNEQARLALNRMARELRQAKSIDAVLADGSGTITGITFDVDFNGNGTIDNSSTDPERLTYCYQPPTVAGGSNGRILLTPNTVVSSCSNPAALPVLDDQVSAMTIGLHSSDWTADGTCGANQPPPEGGSVTQPDGVTQWQELDCAAGEAYPTTPDGLALQGVDSVVLTLRVLHGAETQTYRTQVDLRNKL